MQVSVLTRGAARAIRLRALDLALAIVAVVVASTACSSASSLAPRLSSGGVAATDKDFKIVWYQREELLAGQEAWFSDVFESGKPVLLNFWAGQCPPCRAEMPEFQRAADEFDGKVLFVGVDVGPFTGLGTHDDGRRLLQELGIRYPAAYAVDSSPLQIYNIRSMPTTVFFSASGQVVSTSSGMLFGPQLRSTLSKLVGS